MHLTLITSIGPVFDFYKNLYFNQISEKKPLRAAFRISRKLTAGTKAAKLGLYAPEMVLSRDGKHAHGVHGRPSTSAYGTPKMSVFKVMLMTIAAVFMGLTAANAQPKPKTVQAETSQLSGLTHAVVTEAYFYGPQMDAIAQVIANRAYVYGDPNNLRKVVYNKKEMNGPDDKKTPWKGSEAQRYAKTKDYLSKRFESLVSGTLLAPKYKTAWHFDMRAHTDWGKFLGKECAPQGCVWVYEARNPMVAAKLSQRYKGADIFQIAQN